MQSTTYCGSRLKMSKGDLKLIFETHFKILVQLILPSVEHSRIDNVRTDEGHLKILKKKKIYLYYFLFKPWRHQLQDDVAHCQQREIRDSQQLRILRSNSQPVNEVFEDTSKVRNTGNHLIIISHIREMKKCTEKRVISIHTSTHHTRTTHLPGNRSYRYNLIIGFTKFFAVWKFIFFW